MRDQNDQADSGAVEDWRTQDVPKILKILYDANEQVVKEALMRLHVRWFHASTEQLTQILRAAGSPAKALALIPSIVRACQICRRWTRPGNKTVLSAHLPTSFHEEVQFDLLFYESILEPSLGRRPILHLIDACLRWSATKLLKDKHEKTLCDGISQIWISIFGPMGLLIMDGESCLKSKGASDWATASEVHLKFKAPRQKAWLVERHNEILRQALHRVESQIKEESLCCTFEICLATVTFMHNSLIVIGKSTPYQALLGRQPAMLPPLAGGMVKHDMSLAPESRIINELSGAGQRHIARVREIAAAQIIESTALSRMTQADKGKTVPALERHENEVGDLVDIWFEPQHKEAPGWRGPAKVENVNDDAKSIAVSFQGRTLFRRPQEVRTHVPYLVFLVGMFTHRATAWASLQSYAETMTQGYVTLGMIHKDRWTLTPISRSSIGGCLLCDALEVAAHTLHLDATIQIRISRGAPQLPTPTSVAYFSQAYAFMWIRGSSLEEVVELEPDPGDLHKPFPAQKLAMELEEIDAKPSRWTEVCFIQFLGVDKKHVEEVVRTAPYIPLLGGAGVYTPPVRPGGSQHRPGSPVVPDSRNQNRLQVGMPPTPRRLWPDSPDQSMNSPGISTGNPDLSMADPDSPVKDITMSPPPGLPPPPPQPIRARSQPAARLLDRVPISPIIMRSDPMTNCLALASSK